MTALAPTLSVRVLDRTGPRWLCVWSAIDRGEDVAESFPLPVRASFRTLSARIAHAPGVKGLILCGAPDATEQWGDWSDPLVAVSVSYERAGVDLFLDAIQRCLQCVLEPGSRREAIATGSRLP